MQDKYYKINNINTLEKWVDGEKVDEWTMPEIYTQEYLDTEIEDTQAYLDYLRLLKKRDADELG